MAVWRSAAHVVRRLGREFLIWGGVLMVIYVAVDQYMLHRYQEADAAWAKRYAEIFPETRDGVPPCEAMLELATATGLLNAAAGIPIHQLASVQSYNEVHQHYYEDPDALTTNLFNPPVPGLTVDEDPLELPERIFSLLDEAAACAPIAWPKPSDDEEEYTFVQILQLIMYMMGTSVDLIEQRKSADAARMLVKAGRLIPVYDGSDNGALDTLQKEMEKKLLAALQHMIATDTLDGESAKDFLSLLQTLDENAFHPLRMTSSSYAFPLGVRWSMYEPATWLDRVMQPWSLMGQLEVFAGYHAFADASTIANASKRAVAYREFDLDDNSLSMIASMYLPHLRNSIEQFEQLDSERHAVMLQIVLEAFQIETGQYPKSLDTIRNLLPEELNIITEDIQYEPDAGKQGYRLLARRYPLSGTVGRTSRTWIRRVNN